MFQELYEVFPETDRSHFLNISSEAIRQNILTGINEEDIKNFPDLTEEQRENLTSKISKEDVIKFLDLFNQNGFNFQLYEKRLDGYLHKLDNSKPQDENMMLFRIFDNGFVSSLSTLDDINDEILNVIMKFLHA